jgi:hypothetical protein
MHGIGIGLGQARLVHVIVGSSIVPGTAAGLTSTVVWPRHKPLQVPPLVTHSQYQFVPGVPGNRSTRGHTTAATDKQHSSNNRLSSVSDGVWLGARAEARAASFLHAHALLLQVAGPVDVGSAASSVAGPTCSAQLSS